MALRTPLSVTPHLYMGDSTGRPLDMGTVYFGEQDKDPEFYPINLFSDDALTLPLMQPVNTKGGYLYDKGDMVEPHAKELIYSVKVLDSYGRKVFYKGAMMRNSWNDDVIEQINTAIIGSADVARQVATDITNDAINNTAVEGGVLADTFVTVTTSGVDTVPRTQRDKNSESLSVKDFGAKGDGVTDDTLAIQAAFNHGGNILIPRGEYLVSSQGAATVNRFTFALKVLSNSNITFEKAAKIKLQANAEERCLLLFLDRQTDIVINDLHIIGDRDTHLGTTGEHGHGVGIFGGANVRFNNPTIAKAWGDGVYICSNYTADPDKKVPKNVSFMGGTIKDNSRNGIALAGLDGGLFVDIDYINNDRIEPKAAFDVEPFTSSDKTNSSGVVKNVFVRDSRATGGDVGFMGLFNNTDIPKNSLTFLNLDVENVAKTAYVFGTSNIDDTITARDLRANNIGSNGLSMPHVNSIGSVLVDNIDLKNCNQITNEINELNSAILLYNKNTRPYVLGNVSILNISVDSPLSTHALISNEKGASVTSYGHTENVRFSFKKAKTSLAPISLLKIKSKVQDNTDGDLTKTVEASSLTLNTYAGIYTSYISSSTQRTSFKLPADNYIYGIEITFKVGAGGSLILQPNTSNSIIYNGELVTKFLQSEQKGAWIKVAARDDGQWEVVDTYGDWYRPDMRVVTTGSTEQRPTNATEGHQYFDTTINKPIYWTGSSWVDATGQEV